MNFVEEAVAAANLVKIVCSNPFEKNGQFRKITIGHAQDGQFFHAEKLTKTQAFHQNVPKAQLATWLQDNICGKFKQVCLYLEDKTVTYLFSKNNSRRTESGASNAKQVQPNRAKNYLLKEGENIPAFVDLGVFTPQLRVVAAKQDKFRQINRFVELLDDALKNHTGSITVVDFGCGKSYLTFFVYHYLVNHRHLDAKIIGYDIKADVVQRCNQIAAKYGYSNLSFVVADVSKDNLTHQKTDVVISLHACDTATDFALKFAIEHNVKYVFSVPCCQHEVNLAISKGGELDSLLRYGIIKERTCALLTDSMRAMILEDFGYSVDVLEFVDMEHSPKNIMIRGQKTHAKNMRNAQVLQQLQQTYNFSQTLYKLLYR